MSLPSGSDWSDAEAMVPVDERLVTVSSSEETAPESVGVPESVEETAPKSAGVPESVGELEQAPVSAQPVPSKDEVAAYRSNMTASKAEV